MISVRIHRHGDERILAACDEEILGTVLKGDGIKMAINEGFYSGEIVTEDTLGERMDSASIMNLVGDRAVEVAVSKGFVSKEHIMLVGGVKHVQVVRM